MPLLNKQQLCFANHRYRYNYFYDLKLKTHTYSKFDPLCINNTATANQLVFRYVRARRLYCVSEFSKTQLVNSFVIPSLLQNYLLMHVRSGWYCKVTIIQMTPALQCDVDDYMYVKTVKLPQSLIIDRSMNTETFYVVKFRFYTSQYDGNSVFDLLRLIELNHVPESTRFRIKLRFCY